MSNPWVQHVKEYQNKHGCSYRDAMVLSKPSYKRHVPQKLKKPKRKRGKGIFDTIKNKISSVLTKRPLSIINLLKQYGDQKIEKIEVCRQPITAAIKYALDYVSGGDISKVVAEKGYDNVFHLYCIVTLSSGTRIRLDKNQRVAIVVNPGPLREDAVCKSVTLPNSTTLQEFIDKGEKLGNEWGSFWRYSGWDNNCQKFIRALLNASGVTSLDSFIQQETQEFIKPGLLRKFTGVVTDAAALADYAYHGGKKRKKRRKPKKKSAH